MSDEITLSLRGEPLPEFAAPVRMPAGASPPRRPGSVRRTSTLHVTWPDGYDHPGLLQGFARDILTPLDTDAPGAVLAEDRLSAAVSGRRILSPPIHRGRESMRLPAPKRAST